MDRFRVIEIAPEIGRDVREHVRLKIAMPSECHRRVIWHVEPLMQVDADRVRARPALYKRSQVWGDAGKSAERRIDVQIETVALLQASAEMT